MMHHPDCELCKARPLVTAMFVVVLLSLVLSLWLSWHIKQFTSLVHPTHEWQSETLEALTRDLDDVIHRLELAELQLIEEEGK